MYSCLVVGAGNKGALADAPGTGNEHKYLSYAHAVKDHPGFELSCIVDREPGKERAADNIWKPKHMSRSSVELKGLRFDVAVVATSDETHYDVLKQLTRGEYNGLKLVIAEKPICTEINQAREIIELYEKKGIALAVDYTRLYIPEWQKIKKDINDGVYGRLLYGCGMFNDSFADDMPIGMKRKNAWLHSGSHMVSTALWLFGNSDFEFKYIPSHYKWLYDWIFCFEKTHIGERMGDFTKERVSTIYDNHLMYVMSNAYAFLEGKEPLRCTGDDALMALEETYRLMEAEG